MSDVHCGYTVLDGDGNEQPCDRPATGWRWYQDCGHEDIIDPACDRHENVGRGIHEDRLAAYMAAMVPLFAAAVPPTPSTTGVSCTSATVDPDGGELVYCGRPPGHPGKHVSFEPGAEAEW